MFRDPVFLAIRCKVVRYEPIPSFIWHAGCSTGEEIYSMAILMQEEGLLPSVQVYATDMNEMVLKSQGWYFPVD